MPTAPAVTAGTPALQIGGLIYAEIQAIAPNARITNIVREEGPGQSAPGPRTQAKLSRHFSPTMGIK